MLNKGFWALPSRREGITVNSDLTKCGACLLTGACLPIYFYLCFVFEDDTGQQLFLRFYFFLSLHLASDVGPPR